MNGKFLRERRIEAGFSQAGIGEMLGYSTQTISLWESEKSEPSMIVWGKYASILHIDLEGLVLGQKKKDNDYCINNKFDVEIFSKNLRLLRKKKGLTQKSLAKNIDISVGTIIRFEKGVTLPDSRQFIAICNYYHLKFDALYFGLMNLPEPVPFYKKKYFIPIFLPIVVVLTVGTTTGAAVSIVMNNERRNNARLISSSSEIISQSSESIESEFTSSSDSVDSESSSSSEEWTDIEGTIQYGAYPQSHVIDEDLITALDLLTSTNEVGYYEYNGDYYEKASSRVLGPDYVYYSRYFDNGEKIEMDGRNYWFKVEPITWEIFKENNDSYLLFSRYILDISFFANSRPSSYVDSDIRQFLNNDFYKKAFFFEENGPLLTEVDNSKETNPRCTLPASLYENCFDYVFLPSYSDARSLTEQERIATTTEYTRIKREIQSNNSIYCWTRSIVDELAQSAYAVGQANMTVSIYALGVDWGIRPMVVINK